ncbi:MAG: PilZ domain-containing protein [Planctomycetaceae bacterium]
MSNQRQHERSNVRTLVTVISDDGGQTRPIVIKGWTEDISASGMQIVCHDELPSGRIFVRILLPGLEDKIVECLVVRSAKRETISLVKESGPRYVYGIRFQSVLPLSRFEVMLSEASPPAASAVD